MFLERSLQLPTFSFVPTHFLSLRALLSAVSMTFKGNSELFFVLYWLISLAL